MRAHLDGALVGPFEQDVLRFEVAVDDFMPTQVAQADEDLLREAADETQGEALEVIVLDKLVQVEAQKLEADAQVATKVERLAHVHHVGALVLVLRTGETEDRIIGALSSQRRSTTDNPVVWPKTKPLFVLHRHG